MSHFAIGIDIGGTTSRAALVDCRGNVVVSVRQPTPQKQDEFVRWIVTTVSAWSNSHQKPLKVGLALPGVVDRQTGMLIRSVNLPWLEGHKIADQIEREIGMPPTLLTDAEAATWGEFLDFGSPDARFAHLRLGTGVACGVIVNGKLIPTDPARRTHWPILVVDQSQTAPKCPCGLSGCLELFASGNSLAQKAGELGLGRALDGLRTGYESGDERVVEALRSAAFAVASAIQNLAKTYDVEHVVLGGGVLEALPHLFNSIQLTSKASISIHLTRLKDDAGIIGSARFADLPARREFDVESPTEYGKRGLHGA